MRNLLIIFFALFISACQSSPPNRTVFSPSDLDKATWTEIEQKSRGTIVNFAMYAGDDVRNKYFQTKVAAHLKEKFDIQLQIVPLGDTSEAINKLLNEKGANKTADGSIDMIWINGENFRTAKQAGILWGKFAEKLPNYKLYSPDAGKTDFGTTIEGLETPWQRGQFVLAYDSAKIPNPPKSFAELREFVKNNPGKFTYIAPPDFTGSAFIRHILYSLGGGAEKFQGDFNEELYQSASDQTLKYLNEIKPYLWRKGETYPTNTKEVDRLFANGEIDFAMSYSPTFAAERIKRGEYPATVRTFVFDSGTISNYSYLTIAFNSSNPAGALTVINYLMSPEHLIEQTQELGSIYPHDLKALNEEQRDKVKNLPRHEATLPPEVLAEKAIPEADSKYLERLEKDWREKVLQGF